MQSHWNTDKTVGYENAIKCCLLSISTDERDSEQYYISIVLAVRGLQSPSGGYLDRGLCPAKASARDWTLAGFAACVCTLCSKIGLHNKCNIGKFFTEVGEVNGG